MMAYRVAAVDVHKKMLAVVVADVAGEGEYRFERRKFGAPRSIARAGPMASAAGGRGSSHGIDRTVLETGVGSAGAVLEAGAPEARGGRQDVRRAAPMPCQIQPRAARAEERLRRRRTDDQTAGGAGAGFELRTGCGTAPVANRDAAQAPVDPRQDTLPEPTGSSVGASAH